MSRRVEHFTKQKTYCPRRTGEILYKLQRVGVVLRDALSQRLASEYAERVEGDVVADDFRHHMEAEGDGEADQTPLRTPSRAGGVDGGDAAGESGPILIRMIDMSHRDKTGISLAEIWEDVIRHDIGIKNVNAICTDNAEVMKTAAHTLQTHPDPAMCVIPWIPCAAHCLSLLLRDIAAQPFARQTMRDAQKIVKFICNKQKTLALHKIMKKALVLRRPTKTRFGTTYLMLERLYDQREVLDTLVSSERWARVRWAEDAREWMPHVRRLCRDDGFWSGMKRVMDVMGSVYGDAVMDIVRDRCAMMRQPAHAAAYLLVPRRRDISLLEDRSRRVVQSALEHFARVVGGWDNDAMLSLWEALWTFHNDDPRYWSEDGQHWWDSFATTDANKMHPSTWWRLHGGQQPVLQGIARAVMGMWSTASPCERNWATHDFIHTKLRNPLTARSVEKLVFIHWNLQLLSTSKRSQSRYVDIWADQVEDEEVALDVDDVIPADVAEEEYEAIERSNRRKEGRNRAGKGNAPPVDSENEEEDIFDDLVWMHQGIRKDAEAQRGAGMTLPEDQHELLDEWGGQDPHDDFDAYIGGTMQTVVSMRKRVGGEVDMEELLAHDMQAEEDMAMQDPPRKEEVSVSMSLTAASASTAERTVHSTADDRSECRVQPRVEQKAEQRVERRVDERVEQRVDQRMRDVVEVTVDVTLDQAGVGRMEESTRGRPGDCHSCESVIRDVVTCGRTEQRLHTDGAARDRPGLDRIRGDGGDRAQLADTGIPPLPPRDTSPSSHDVLTRRTFYGIPPLPLRTTPPPSTATTPEIHSRRSTTPRLGAKDTSQGGAVDGTAAGGSPAVGVRTRAHSLGSGGRETRVLDDDPESGDDSSGSDYARERRSETRGDDSEDCSGGEEE
ncbi:hypothetical protein CBR_g54033 [Chara braunii]|uniref:DUF659 domain-containing protein n=1 Tax=Chara braunii TaxID=69332 RepID=A0A388MBJ4_CHABU|nr:hypothetical protein CBR_g54033 [Chara braunii]|eukprot:GBG91938.1 hypothetical protein CBR_g54033 [Chara braunii]